MSRPERIVDDPVDIDARPVMRVAVLIPCFNEEAGIAKVVGDFRAALPRADIYVYDNNSTDRTAALALEAGAIVRREPQQGKGRVVRRMFCDVEADVFVLVDGDATYDAPSVVPMIVLLQAECLDMVVAARVDQEKSAYRLGHRAGNRILTAFVVKVFRAALTDMLSGYRVLSRRFVKSFPVLSRGFEIETELTAHALELQLPIAEIKAPYYSRPEGSMSKLSTWRDGWRILRSILRLYRSERPLGFYSAIGGLLAVVSLALFFPVFMTYLEHGIVHRLPTAILSMGLMLLAFLSLASGLILDTVTRGRREMKLLAYLAQKAPHDAARHELVPEEEAPRDLMPHNMPSDDSGLRRAGRAS
jgi:glycosyltransferase involved in cell wall biosynthesis